MGIFYLTPKQIYLTFKSHFFMLKKIFFFTITIPTLFLFASCSSDNNLKKKESVCKILKYNKIAPNIYQAEFIYQNGRLIKRLQFGNIVSPSIGQTIYGKLSEDSIVYNSNNTIAKIVYKKDKLYDLFFYNGNSRLPYKRENIKVSDNGNSTARWIENIQYDSQNRIIQTIGDYDDEQTEVNKKTTKYSYDSKGNLSQVSEINNPLDGNTTETITSYSNYDSSKNPFKNSSIPFIDYRNKSYSENNYRASISKSIYKGDTTIGNFWEISSYQYNEFDYPLFAEYECN